MSGIFDYTRYIDLLRTIKDIREHFPIEQLTVDFDINGLDSDGWSTEIDWITMIVDRMEYIRDVPSFENSKILGYFPKGHKDQVGVGILQIPANMYTGPILPERLTKVPVTLVSYKFTKNLEIWTKQFLLIENWCPGITIGDPTLDPDFYPEISETSILSLTSTNYVLIGDNFSLNAKTDIPLTLNTGSFAKFYNLTTSSVNFIGSATFVDKIATLSVDSDSYGLGTPIFYATFEGQRQYGFSKSNNLTKNIISGFPLNVQIELIPSNVTPVSSIQFLAGASSVPGYPSLLDTDIQNTATINIVALGVNTGENQNPYSTSTQFNDSIINLNIPITESFSPTNYSTLTDYVLTSGSISGRNYNFNLNLTKLYSANLHWFNYSPSAIGSGNANSILTVSTSKSFVKAMTPLKIDVVKQGTLTTSTEVWSTQQISLRSYVDLPKSINALPGDLEFRANYAENYILPDYTLPSTPEFKTNSVGTGQVFMPLKLASNQALFSQIALDGRPALPTANISGTTFEFPYDPADPSRLCNTGTFTPISSTTVSEGILVTMDRNWTVNPYYNGNISTNSTSTYTYEYTVGPLSFSYTRYSWSIGANPLYNSDYPTWFDGAFNRTRPNPARFSGNYDTGLTTGVYKFNRGLTLETGTNIYKPGKDVLFKGRANPTYSTQEYDGYFPATGAYPYTYNGVTYPAGWTAKVTDLIGIYVDWTFYSAAFGKLYTTSSYGINTNVSGTITETNRLYFNTMPNDVTVGSLVTLPITSVSGNTSYVVASTGSNYLVLDPPWFTHQPDGYPGLRNVELIFTNPGTTSTYHVNRISEINTSTWNKIKFSNTTTGLTTGSIFRLAGNINSPFDQTFSIESTADGSGWWTIDPPYAISTGNTQTYFMANEANRDIVFLNTTLVNTDESYTQYAIGLNKIKLTYTPKNLINGATMTVLGTTFIIDIDPTRDIVTLDRNLTSGELAQLATPQKATFVNAVPSFTNIFVGTATYLTSSPVTNEYQWTFNTQLDPGSYLLTATIVNHVITGTNATVDYPCANTSSFNLLVSDGLNADLTLILDTTPSAYNTVKLISSLNTAVDPQHFYTFQTSVQFYNGSNLIGNSGWTRIPGTYVQIASANIPKSVSTSTLNAYWPGNLTYPKTYEDQFSFSPLTRYYV